MVHKGYFYKIAGLYLKIAIPPDVDVERILPSFKNFLVDGDYDDQYFMEVRLCVDSTYPKPQACKLLSDISYILDYRFRFEESEAHYITTVVDSDKDHPYSMFSSKDFRKNTIYASANDIYDNFQATWMIMVAFGQCILQEQGMLIHASAIVKDNKVQAFLGISGTGKSTHSRLWLTHISGTSLLNDDNPAIRIHDDGSIWMYGTPWSGKTVCYKNEQYPLQALVRLEQAPENKISRLVGGKALMALLPSGSAIRWNDTLFQLMIDHASYLATHISIGYLTCLPDKEAAKLSYNFCVNGD